MSEQAAEVNWRAIAEQRDRELRVLGERKYRAEQERDALREERDALRAELARMEGVETRTEWAWAHDNLAERCLHTVPCEEDARKTASHFDGIQVMRRQMQIGPWESVDAVRVAEGDTEQRRADLAEREGRECDALCRDVEEDRDRLAAEVERLRADRGKLTATIAAFPDAHNAANLAHARMERDALRAEVARVRADVSEEIARAIEGIRDGWMRDHEPDEIQGVPEALHDAALKARVIGECAVAPAESVVGALPDVVGTPDLKEG